MSETVKLVISDWGPVSYAEVELKPLTIFIGQNNTGKSYTAMLYYALLRALQQTLHSLPWRMMIRRRLLHAREAISAIEEAKKVIHEVIEQYVVEERRPESRASLDSLASELAPSIRDLVAVLGSLLGDALRANAPREIERVYSTKLVELVRAGASGARVRLECGSRSARLLFELLVERGRVHADSKLELRDTHEVAKVYAGSLLARLALRRATRGISDIDEASLVYALFDALGKITLGGRHGVNVHYLPASRAGLLQGYRAIASAIVTLAPLAAIRGVELPGFTGPSADFLASLISIEPEVMPPRHDDTVRLLEGLIEGRVEVVRESPEKPPVILYRSESISIPLARASSMIGELAPLDIYLRYGLVTPRDVLVIEEPEAHLHPEKQARLAELLAALVNNMKLSLLITTHSDVLLAKIGNLVAVSTLPPEEAEKLGYSRDRILKPEQVAVYHFKPTGEGAIVEQVPVSEEGIPDDAFRRVVEDLYRETMDIYYRLQRSKSLKGWP